MKISAAMERAKAHYDAAPAGRKPTARDLADKFNLNKTSIYRAGWFAKRPYTKTDEKNDE